MFYKSLVDCLELLYNSSAQRYEFPELCLLMHASCRYMKKCIVWTSLKTFCSGDME